MSTDASKTLKRTGLLVTALGAALVAGYAIRSARAQTIPSPNTLSYSGTLLTFGTPDNSTHGMLVSLYAGSTQLCTTSATVTCLNGQFSVPLPSTCVTAIQANPNVTAQLSVDGTQLGSQGITAVPYSVVAQVATTATTATSATTAGSATTATSATTAASATNSTKIGGNYINSGGFNFTMSSNYTNGSISFTSPFTAPPMVVCSESGTSGGWVVCKFDVVSTTGANYAIAGVNGTSASYGGHIAWMAIGD